MDSKNVIAAIALSSAVIVLYSLFFVPEQSTSKKNLSEKNKIEQNGDTPVLDQKETLIQTSREDALKIIKKNPFVGGEKMIEYTAKKLGITLEEFHQIMSLKVKSFRDYPTYYSLIKRLEPIIKLGNKLNFILKIFS